MLCVVFLFVCLFVVVVFFIYLMLLLFVKEFIRLKMIYIRTLSFFLFDFLKKKRAR